MQIGNVRPPRRREKISPEARRVGFDTLRPPGLPWTSSLEVGLNTRAVCTVGLAMILTGCGRTGGSSLPAAGRSKSAVRQAIEAHLKERSNLLMANMTVEVQEVNFSGDRAEALVRYQSKQAPDLAVRVRYVLRKVGEHWEVESSSRAGGMPGAPHGPSSSHEGSPRAPALEPSH